MELKFNEAKTARPNHLERCLCYDKFLKGYRCYVYDDISKYWCTQATTEHDPNGDNHIVDYADYQVTKWASLQQGQPETDGDDGKFVKILVRKEFAKQFQKLGDEIQAGQSFFIRAINQQEQPDVDLDEEIHDYMKKHHLQMLDGGRIVFENGDTPNFIWDFRDFAGHFYELGLKTGKEN